MAIVAAYQFRAKFRTHHDPQGARPRIGLSREGLLLLRQEEDVRSDADAVAACELRGAYDAVISDYGIVDLAKAQLPQNKDFLPMYEQALRDGAALSYNPNSAPPEEKGSVTQWGFSSDK